MTGNRRVEEKKNQIKNRSILGNPAKNKSIPRGRENTAQTNAPRGLETT